MTIQIAIIERKDDGSEERRGLCEFVSIPGAGDQIFVTRNKFTDQLRVIAIDHYPLGSLKDNIDEQPRIKLLAELIKTHSTYPFK